MAIGKGNERDAIREVASRLSGTFAGDVATDEVDDTVERIYHRFDGSKVRDYIPLLVERGAKQELRAHGIGKAGLAGSA